MTKIGVEKIEITRGEGPHYECGKTQTVSSWVEADQCLAQMSQSAPAQGGYDKTDFVVTFEDGQTWEGTYDLKHWTVELPSLQRHIKGFVLTYGGIKMPLWMETHKQGEEFWADIKARGEEDGSGPEMRDFGARYDVGVNL